MVLAEPTGKLYPSHRAFHIILGCVVLYRYLLNFYCVLGTVWHWAHVVERLALMGPAALGRQPIFIYHFLPWVL